MKSRLRFLPKSGSRLLEPILASKCELNITLGSTYHLVSPEVLQNIMYLLLITHDEVSDHGSKSELESIYGTRNLIDPTVFSLGSRMMPKHHDTYVSNYSPRSWRL